MTTIAEIKYRLTQEWYEDWTKSGVTMAHSLVRMLRTVVSFGATLIEDAECARVCSVLRASKFKNAKPRDKWLTAEQAVAVRKMARKMGFPSIALAQAFQFEGMLRQKDVIGEWIPITEPGESDVIDGNEKWMCGIRWSEVDADLRLTHITSKRQKEVTKDLKLAAMVLDELKLIGALPDTGPIIVCEHTGRPWRAADFRRQWRAIATAAKVPTDVRNMDTRAGAITEALNAGAPLDSVRKAATHSDPQMTARYSRNEAEADANVSRIRAAARAA